MKRPSVIVVLTVVCVALLSGCRHAPPLEPDKPQLTVDVRLIEDTIHSKVLGRDMAVRFIVPIATFTHDSLPVIFLLHGAGTTYRDWTNNSQIAAFAARGAVLVLPNMPGAFYINQANGSGHQYEDYFLRELIPETHRLVPNAAGDREHNAIIGISRGGYGAAVLGLKHPQMFGYVGLLSPAVDFAERGFRWRAPLQSLELQRIFGPKGSSTRRDNDPFRLIATVPKNQLPTFFLACGDQDVLLAPTQRFSSKLSTHNAEQELHLFPGGHNWNTWNQALPLLETSLWQSFSKPGSMKGLAQ